MSLITTNLNFRFTAKQGVTSSGGDVSQWDSQADVYDLSVAVGQGGPRIGDVTLNGHNVITFDGTNDLLELNNSSVERRPAFDSFSMTYLYVRVPASNGFRYIIDSQNADFRMAVNSLDTNLIRGTGGTSTRDVEASYTPSEWMVVTVRWARDDFGSGDDIISKLYIDGTEVDTDTFTTSGSTGLVMGGHSDASGLAPFDIAEMCEYHDISAAHTPSEINQMVTYFQDEWAQTSIALTAEQGSYTLSGQTTGLNKTYLLAADDVAFISTGFASDLLRHLILNAESRFFDFATNDVRLLEDVLISLVAGNYSLTGQDATLARIRSLQAGQGDYTLTGQTVGLLRSLILGAESTSFTLTGQDADLLKSILLGAEQGDYTLSGQDITLVKSLILQAEQGSITLDGQPASILRRLLLEAQQGDYSLTGQTAQMLRSLVIVVEQGDYGLTGEDVELLRALILSAEQGGYTFSGQEVLLTVLAFGAFSVDVLELDSRITTTLEEDSKIATVLTKDSAISQGISLDSTISAELLLSSPVTTTLELDSEI